MKLITYSDIVDIGPCYDPVKYIPVDWKGTVIDILNIEECPVEDRLWVVLREDFIDARTLRLFAVWCAREALKLVDNPDPRSISACDVSERYANGDASDAELSAARAAAREAAWAAEGAAWAAAREAAWAAARAAAMEAARAAARAAAREAAWAAWAAEGAAWEAEGAAWEAAREAQIEQLKKMLQ